MKPTTEQELRERLVQMRNRHRELDEEIVALETSSSPDQVAITRLKKRKLRLKDEIGSVEDRLTPDIIA